MRKRTKKKPVGPHLDHDLRKREAKGERIQNVGRANIKKAKAESKGTGLLGTDGITYSGPNRRLYNSGQMRFRYGHNVKQNAGAERKTREARRNRQSLNIRQRQRRKKGY